MVVGDLASSPEEQTVIFGEIPMSPSHVIFRGSGFRDVLTPNPFMPGKKVCCQREDLRSAKSRLDLQADAIFLSHLPDSTQLEILGDTTIEWALGGKIWPSDHASVLARIRFGVNPEPAPRP